MLGTSGTVTTIAGVHLDLPRYERRRVDGCWMSDDAGRRGGRATAAMSYDSRVANPASAPSAPTWCWRAAPSWRRSAARSRAERLRVADRGLREGMLVQMMREDAVWGSEAAP
jgi:exopolyphosphatase / guanosine-5'-triphosphate,3'-diphosphate pyrophosphatase